MLLYFIGFASAIYKLGPISLLNSPCCAYCTIARRETGWVLRKTSLRKLQCTLESTYRNEPKLSTKLKQRRLRQAGHSYTINTETSKNLSLILNDMVTKTWKEK